MTFGMSVQEYFEGDLSLLEIYANYYVRSEKTRFAEQDTMAWMIGSYVLDAFQITAHGVYGKKGTRSPDYAKTPKFIEQIDEEARKRKEEQKLYAMEANLLAAARRIGKA